MMKYYKATDGVITVFRATERRTYASAWIRRHAGPDHTVGIGFSPKEGGYPVVEISRDEYTLLGIIRDKRLFAGRIKDSIPRARDAWVRNDELIDNCRVFD